jgi:ATP sulfurylase
MLQGSLGVWELYLHPISAYHHKLVRRHGGCDHMVVGFTITCAISAYYH